MIQGVCLVPHHVIRIHFQHLSAWSQTECETCQNSSAGVLFGQNFWERLDYERIKYQTVVRWVPGGNDCHTDTPSTCSGRLWEHILCAVHLMQCVFKVLQSCLRLSRSDGNFRHVQDKTRQNALHQEEDRGNLREWSSFEEVVSLRGILVTQWEMHAKTLKMLPASTRIHSRQDMWKVLNIC